MNVVHIESRTMRKLLALSVVALLAASFPAAAQLSDRRSGREVVPAEQVRPAVAAGTATLAATRTPSRSVPRVDDDLTALLARVGPDQVVSLFVHAADVRTAVRAAGAAGLDVFDTFDRIGVAVAAGRPDAVRRLMTASDVSYLEANRELRWAMETSHVATRSLEARSPQNYSVTRKVTTGTGRARRTRTVTESHGLPGITGAGVGVAVIDSGVDGTHPMFQAGGRSKVVRNLKLVCASGVLIPLEGPCQGPTRQPIDAAFVDVRTNDSDTPSNGGHGTHVSGTAVGVDVTATDKRKLTGAAPGAKLVHLSVGQVISVYGGNAGLNWVLRHHKAPCGPTVSEADCPDIKVVNNSYGAGGGRYDPEDATSKLQDLLVAEGVVVVWAAGNDGGDGSTIETNPPGNSPTPGVLSVAAYDDGNTGSRDGAVAGFSSRGSAKDPTTYPDIAAPGASITSACRPTLPVCTSGEGDLNYGTIGGTSMAAPHIAGIVAQLFQAKPNATPAEIELALVETAHRFAAGGSYRRDQRNPRAATPTSFDKGHGLVDTVRATAFLLSRPLPPAPAPGCAPSDPVVVDIAGDARNVLVPTPLPNEPLLDVLEGRVVWDAPSGTVAFVTRVAKVTKSDPSGSSGSFHEFEFAHGGVTYQAIAQRSAGTASFSLGKVETTRTIVKSGLKGRFDEQANTITVFVSNADLVGTSVKPFAGGDALSGFSITSRRQVGRVIPDADRAPGRCPFTLGVGAVPAKPVIVDESAPKAHITPHTDGEAVLRKGDTFQVRGAPSAPTAAYECDGPGDRVCRTYQLDLPPGGGSLSVALTATGSPATDYDLFVLNGFGELVGSSADLGSAEKGAFGVPGGRYFVVVQPFLAAPQTPFTLSAKLS